MELKREFEKWEYKYEDIAMSSACEACQKNVRVTACARLVAPACLRPAHAVHAVRAATDCAALCFLRPKELCVLLTGISLRCIIFPFLQRLLSVTTSTF